MLKYDAHKDETFDKHVADRVQEISERFNIDQKDQNALKLWITGICAMSAEMGFKQAKEEIQNIMFGVGSK